MPFGFHGFDLIIILIIALIIFGPRKLPEIGGALGKSLQEFKKASNEMLQQARPSKAPQLSQPSSLGHDDASESASPNEEPENLQSGAASSQENNTPK